MRFLASGVQVPEPPKPKRKGRTIQPSDIATMDITTVKAVRNELVRRLGSSATSPAERKVLPEHLRAVGRRLTELDGGHQQPGKAPRAPSVASVDQRVADARSALYGPKDPDLASRAESVKKSMLGAADDDVLGRTNSARRALRPPTDDDVLARARAIRQTMATGGRPA